ncbi:MAG: hypothetical protein JOZ27_05655, partial [Caulobacteraceae bacterium]|nr:hypothetical protein [Caulobacteraceae bacterium]
QIYFDFSGYSDMAIGLGRMFGVKLPLNFHSPLRAPSITDYWRRWHMTLQRFIVSYLFQPFSLPMTRISASLGLSGWADFLVSSVVPIFVTFVAVGIWHGAGWTFILFGVMHGVYISVNQAWEDGLTRRRRRLRRAGVAVPSPGPARTAGAHVLTLLAVLFANVLFRSPTVAEARRIWSSMIGLAGRASVLSLADQAFAAMLVASAAVIFLAPNSQQIMGRFDPAYNWREWRAVASPPLRWTWKPDAAGLAFIGAALFMGVMFIQQGRAVFLYFNF